VHSLVPLLCIDSSSLNDFLFPLIQIQKVTFSQLQVSFLHKIFENALRSQLRECLEHLNVILYRQMAPAALCTPLCCIILAADKIIHHRWGGGGNRSPRGRACARIIMSTTNSTLNGLEKNPGLRGEGERLSACTMARPCTKQLPTPALIAKDLRRGAWQNAWHAVSTISTSHCVTELRNITQSPSVPNVTQRNIFPSFQRSDTFAATLRSTLASRSRSKSTFSH
jgi:hypothetical protein